MIQIQVSQGSKKRITWTEQDNLLKSGNSIRFHNESAWWNIDNVYDYCLEKANINRS